MKSSYGFILVLLIACNIAIFAILFPISKPQALPKTISGLNADVSVSYEDNVQYHQLIVAVCGLVEQRFQLFGFRVQSQSC